MFVHDVALHISHDVLYSTYVDRPHNVRVIEKLMSW